MMDNFILAPPDSIPAQDVVPGPAESASPGCWLETWDVPSYPDSQHSPSFLLSPKSWHHVLFNLCNAHVMFRSQRKNPHGKKEFRIASGSRCVMHCPRRACKPADTEVTRRPTHKSKTDLKSSLYLLTAEDFIHGLDFLFCPCIPIMNKELL